jgi:hypothetical protein
MCVLYNRGDRLPLTVVCVVIIYEYVLLERRVSADRRGGWGEA